MFFNNNFSEVSSRVQECSNLFFKAKESIFDKENEFPIRQFRQRNAFNGYYSYYSMKIIDCVNDPPFNNETYNKLTGEHKKIYFKDYETNRKFRDAC